MNVRCTQLFISRQ